MSGIESDVFKAAAKWAIARDAVLAAGPRVSQALYESLAHAEYGLYQHFSSALASGKRLMPDGAGAMRDSDYDPLKPLINREREILGRTGKGREVLARFDASERVSPGRVEVRHPDSGEVIGAIVNAEPKDAA